MSWVNGQGYLISDTPVPMIRNFISSFRNHPSWIYTDPDNVLGYIDPRAGDEFALWDVCFTGNNNEGPHKLVDYSLGVPLNLQERTKGNATDSQQLTIGNNRRISTEGIGQVGLSDTEKQKAREEFEKMRTGPFNGVPDGKFTEQRKRPLLIVHLLGVRESAEGELLYPDPVPAWGYIMPAETKHPEKAVEVIANQVLLKQLGRMSLHETIEPEQEFEEGLNE